MNESKTKKPAGVKRKTKEKAKEEEQKQAVVEKNKKKQIPDQKKSQKRSVSEKKHKKTKIQKESKVANEESKRAKRAWPAFFFFQAEKRLQLKKENPGISQKDLVRKLGEMWRGLSDAQKKPYHDQEKIDKERYNKEKEELKDSGNIAPVSKKKSKKGAKKDLQTGPKRAWPPFFFFQKERREYLKEENPDLNHKQIVSKLGEEWRGFSEEDKQPFIERSLQDQRRYDKEK